MSPDPRKKVHFDITYRTPDGDEHRIRSVHQHLVSDIANLITLDKRFYDVRIDGRTHAEHREIFGGRVIQEVPELKKYQEIEMLQKEMSARLPFHVGETVQTPRGIGKIVGAGQHIVTVFSEDFGEVVFGVEAIKKVR